MKTKPELKPIETDLKTAFDRKIEADGNGEIFELALDQLSDVAGGTSKGTHIPG